MIKVLAIGDAGAPTGFERVLRKNMDYLHKTGKFEVCVAGIGYEGNPEYPYDYKVYPFHGEFMGFGGLEKLTQRLKPDVLWMVQDMWNLVHAMSNKPVEIPSVCYFPVDTPNVKWSYAMATGAMAQPVAYTKYGANEVAAGVRDALDLLREGIDLKELSPDEKRTWLSLPHPESKKLNLRLDLLARWQNPENIAVVPHGTDSSKYYPMNKKETRKKLGIDPDAFVVGCASTNQFRKRQDLVIRAFSYLAKENPKARLLLWCWNNDERGWDLHQLARYYGVFDKVYFVHDQIAQMEESDLNEMYNCMDVHVNLSGGEGWGLTSVESALCGVTQIVPDWSATREIWQGSGILAPVVDYRAEPKSLNTMHAICDVKFTGETLIQLSADRDLCKEWGKKAYDKAMSLPTWDDTGKQFEKLLKRAVIGNLPPNAMSFNEVFAARKGECKSELANRPVL